MTTTPSTLPETVKDYPEPTAEDLEDLLLICRYGELEELQQFVDRLGKGPLERCRDEDGNGVLHMVCGNGHLGEFFRVSVFLDLGSFFFLSFCVELLYALHGPQNKTNAYYTSSQIC